MAGKYLTFKLSQEEYGVPILTVQRIIQLQQITPVPRTPDFIAGVINLRGQIIPIVRLRNKLNMESVDNSESTCIIVVQFEFEKDEMTIGVLIDEVSEVLFIDDKQIQETPNFGADIKTDFITSIAKFNNRIIMLLAIDKILSIQELNALSKMEKEA